MAGFYESKLKGVLLPMRSDERLQVQKSVGRLKSFSEYLEGFSQAVQGTDLASALETVSPWLEAGADALKESVAPIKFVAKVLEGVGRIDDPRLLGHLACSLAYQRAFEVAISWIPELAELKVEAAEAYRRKDEPDTSIIDGFSFDRALQHGFVRNADAELEHFFRYTLNVDNPVLLRRLVGEIHNRFVLELRDLLSDREMRERFDPFYRWLQQDSDSGDAFAALKTHAEYQSWLFHERPVLDSEAFALAHIYQPLDCGVLTWQEIDKPAGGRVPDPFDERNGGQHPLLETVLQWIKDPKNHDALVVQGSAGSGKSTFSLRLCKELDRLALRPIRVELKNLGGLSHGTDVMEAFSQAVELSNPQRGGSVPLRHRGKLLTTELFDDLVEVGEGERRIKISRYVLILDGWDELSLTSSEGYQQRLGKVLGWVRDELLRNRPLGIVRVLLIGRPTSAIYRAHFMTSSTRVLTVRPLTPDQLDALVERFAEQTAAPPIPAPTGNMAWSLEGLDEILTSLVRRYQEEERRRLEQPSDDPKNRLDALGQPLLVHLTLRLVAAKPDIAERLLNDATALYRSMVDLVVQAGGKAEGAGQERRQQQHVILGNKLRVLLQDTAVTMQALGVRDLARDELIHRLNTTWTNLESRLGRIDDEQILSRLMISFFFKSGHPELGCAFSHKSFREYLYAERVVERLKEYGRNAGNSLSRRVEEDDHRYWKDFEEWDSRRSLFRSLAELLGPQWLNQEEVEHLKNLLFWELQRSFFEDPFPRSPEDAQTEPLEMHEWIRVRNGLASLWEAWGEGIHLRALPVSNGEGFRKGWPLALQVADLSLTKAERDGVMMPKRTNTIDAHFGDGLFRLTAWLHGWFWERGKKKHRDQTTLSAYQILDEEWGLLRFTPSGHDVGFLALFSCRVNSAGFRPAGVFPSQTSLTGAYLTGANLNRADLRAADLNRADLRAADLNHADLNRANLNEAVLTEAVLTGADLTGANLNHADLNRAKLNHAVLTGAKLNHAKLNSAKLNHAKLNSAKLTSAVLNCAVLNDAKLNHARLDSASLTDAVLNHAFLIRANLTSAVLNHADLRGSKLNSAVLTGANLRRADLTSADLRGADLTSAVLTGANLRGADLTSAVLTDADLREANLNCAVLTDAQFAGAKGLERPCPAAP